MNNQFFGLNDWARTLVNKIRSVEVINAIACHQTGQIIQVKTQRRSLEARRTVIGTITQSENPQKEIAKLYRYSFSDGRYFEETLQFCPLNGANGYYLALKDSQNRTLPESLWRESDINV